MGVDTRLFLSPKACVDDVAEAIGIAFGLKPVWSDIPSVSVPGVSIKTYDKIPTMVSILINAGQKQDWRSYFYHFETPTGERLLSGRSTAENIALFVRIAETFGGRVIFDDCKSSGSDGRCDLKAPVFKHIHADDGDGWKARQNRIANVEPLTPDFIRTFKEVAAYKGDRS